MPNMATRPTLKVREGLGTVASPGITALGTCHDPGSTFPRTLASPRSLYGPGSEPYSQKRIFENLHSHKPHFHKSRSWRAWIGPLESKRWGARFWTPYKYRPSFISTLYIRDSNRIIFYLQMLCFSLSTRPDRGFSFLKIIKPLLALNRYLSRCCCGPLRHLTLSTFSTLCTHRLRRRASLSSKLGSSKALLGPITFNCFHSIPQSGHLLLIRLTDPLASRHATNYAPLPHLYQV